jgi:hypothetical protein
VAAQVLAMTLTLMLAGQRDHWGLVITTVTVKEQVAVPPPAVTTKVLVVTPTGKLAPLAKPAVWLVDAPGQLSVPTGAV